jgi:glycosyltransferase involved in cell wall biosynthesis
MPDAPRFSVFTATYNRAHTLHRVFDSLRAQTRRDFEWLVIDDGSTDGTEELVGGWAASADFPIRYFRQDHAGKHVAHNLAAREARGQFFLPLDSDDAYVPQALERMAHRWNTIPAHEQPSFCGIGGLCIDQHGQLVGERFPVDPLDASVRERRYIHRIRGEKCVAVLTDVVRQFPFPEVPGTSFIPEGVVWLAIGKTHKMRWVNETFRVYYTGDIGVSGPRLTGRRNLRESAPGRLYYYVWLLNNDLEYFFRSPTPFLKAALMLPVVAWLSKRSLGDTIALLHDRLARVLVWLVLPLASLVYVGDKALARSGDEQDVYVAGIVERSR